MDTVKVESRPRRRATPRTGSCKRRKPEDLPALMETHETENRERGVDQRNFYALGSRQDWIIKKSPEDGDKRESTTLLYILLEDEQIGSIEQYYRFIRYGENSEAPKLMIRLRSALIKPDVDGEVSGWPTITQLKFNYEELEVPKVLCFRLLTEKFRTCLCTFLLRSFTKRTLSMSPWICTNFRY